MTNQLKIWVDEILNEQSLGGYTGTYTNPLNLVTPIPISSPTPLFDASGNRIFTLEEQEAIMNAINQPPTTP